MNRVPLAAGAAAILVVVIGGGFLLSQRTQPAPGGPVTSPSVEPSPSLDVSPSAPAARSGIVLERAPTNLGCDAIGVEYSSATIHIDPESDIDVWAQANTGTRLAVYWTAGFNATDGDTPVIRGPRGEEVARDGTKTDEISKRTGYFMCGGTESFFILEYQPG